MQDELRLMTVHAHPDDEASKGPATVAKYHAEGVGTALVCCTGGEEGEILNPALDRPEVRDRIGEVRKEELARAAEAIGYDEVIMLGYRDSGMAGSESNARPDSFAQAPLDEAVGRLVREIRRFRPHVLVAYGDEQSGYPHPDHIRDHEVTVAAFSAAADPVVAPETGAPWQVAKLYYTVFPVRRFTDMHEKFLELGLESPFDEEWQARWEKMPEQPVTTRVDISGFASVRREALLAHATQIDPESKFWFGLPPEVLDTVHPVDEYELARVADGVPVAPAGTIEDDLFAGVRTEG